MGKNIRFSEHTNTVFEAMNTNYEAMNNLMCDLALGRQIYDAETDSVISKAEANQKVYDFSLKVLGIDDKNDKKQVRRAFRDHGREWMDVIEDTIDATISANLTGTDFWSALVESKNIADGDRNDFIVHKDSYLSVAEVGRSHHDHILQSVAEDQVVTIPTKLCAVKIGADLNRYIKGDVDWSAFIEQITKAFDRKILAEVAAEISVAADKLPVKEPFVGTGALSDATRDDFDEKIENVEAANDGANVVIAGTSIGLKKVSKIADVNWGSNEQKDNVAHTGTIGIYDGNVLSKFPQRFTDGTFSTKVFDDNKLYFLPTDGDKIVKVVDEGDTRINEITDAGEQNGHWGDYASYEVQRNIGVGVIIGKIFGQWTITK